ncbi:Alpha/Beta hydrolase protein [Aspergillus varians]
MPPSSVRLLALSLLFPHGLASPLHRADVWSPDAVRYEGTTANTVESFLNIRFGEDTSGANRFAPPRPFTPPPGTIVNATNAGAACSTSPLRLNGDGATGVGLQITAYGGSRQAPFQRAIMQSGSPMADPGTASNKSTEHTAQLTKLLNCTAVTSVAELQWLRSLPMDTLNSVSVAYQNQVGGEDGMDVFIPTSPSTFIPESPSKLLSTGRFARNVDIIGGWNEDDGSFSTPTSLTTEKDVAVFLKDEYPAFSTSDIARALALYSVSSFSSRGASLPPANRNITAHYFRASQMKRDAEFACPSLYMAQMMGRYSTTSTANYLFALNQTLFREMYAAVDVSYLGVSHFSDIPYVFNQVESEDYAPFASAQDSILSSEMSGSWAALHRLEGPRMGMALLLGWVGAENGNGGYTLQVIGEARKPDQDTWEGWV